MSTRAAMARARRGAAFLDKRLGCGWRRKIRRRDLDMGCGSYTHKGDCGCILAQLYGDYDSGLDALRVEGSVEGERLGFDEAVASYKELTEAWLEVLREKP